MIGGFFVGALVLGACVPLYIAANRNAEIGMRRAQTSAMAREVGSRFREDVRQATRVDLPGGDLHLTLGRASEPGVEDRVLYRRTAEGLVREVRPGNAARPTERAVYGAPLREARFSRAGQIVRARLEFLQVVSGREVRLGLDCAATPRSAP